MKAMKCPACGDKLVEKRTEFIYDKGGEFLNGRVYRCVQCATTVLVPY